MGDIPGFGQSEEEYNRDQIIAYWEAWKRSDYISSCMAAKGFKWVPEALYADNSVLRIAGLLGVEPTFTPIGSAIPAEEQNANLRATRYSSTLDNYYEALYNESAAGIAYLNQRGPLPAGKNPKNLAQGGCRAEAWSAVGSLGDVRMQLRPAQIALLQTSRQTPEHVKLTQDYSECFRAFGFTGITGPWDVDASTAAGIDKAEHKCEATWQAAEDAGMAVVFPEFVRQHRDTIAQQLQKYSKVAETIFRDQRFLEFLAVRAGECEAILAQDQQAN